MKKVLFLTILPFLLLGTASVSAQVRIGGSSTPYKAAVLDLNVNDDATPSENRGGLALPRVELATVTMELNNTAPINGMLVYNTGGILATGVYVWMTDKWVKASTGSVDYTDSESIILSGTSFKRSALTGDVTADEDKNETIIADDAVTSAKIKNGAVTQDDLSDNSVTSSQIVNGTIIGLDIAAYEIEEEHLADGAVTASKLDAMGAGQGDILVYDGTTWAPAAASGSLGEPGGGRFVVLSRTNSQQFNFDASNYYVPIACRPGAGAVGLFHPVGTFWASDGTLSYDGYARIFGETNVAYNICAYNSACTCIFQTF
jgi:hypothetical protein